MLKKLLTIAILCPLILFGQGLNTNTSSNSGVFESFGKLSSWQLLDTADYYYSKNQHDTALVCYNLFVNTSSKDADIELQKRIIKTYVNIAVIYCLMCNYQTGYEYLLKALHLSEKINHLSELSRIYVNIGTVYLKFDELELAKQYYSKAMELPQDSAYYVLLLNNTGALEMKNNNFDRACNYFNKSLQISKRHNNIHLPIILNAIAYTNQKRNLYDSAFYYFKLSLEESIKSDKIEGKVKALSGLGELFFEIGKLDSAAFYANLSNSIAARSSFPDVVAENYIMLSKTEEAKGNIKKAFEYFKKHAGLRDSVLSVKIFGDISQHQRLYEISKTNQQIEELTIDRQVKEKTIHYQKMIQSIIFVTVILLIIVLIIIVYQNKKLKTAYTVLVNKNIEIIKGREKNEKGVLIEKSQKELLNRILTIMEDISVICNTDFSIEKLAELTNSNQKYISMAINDSLKKNFRTFLNEYRIREAQRLFALPDTSSYTIEYVAHQVGFKSRSNFSDVFKDITGVSPYFYAKSLRIDIDSNKNQ